MRDKEGHEIDAFIESAAGIIHGIEVKAGETVASDAFAGLDDWRQHFSEKIVF